MTAAATSSASTTDLEGFITAEAEAEAVAEAEAEAVDVDRNISTKVDLTRVNLKW